jgi:hypothetical protein
MASDTDERDEFSDAELERLYAVYNGRDAAGARRALACRPGTGLSGS